jgi:hypothetical protein
MFSLLQPKTTYQHVQQADSPSMDTSNSAHEDIEYPLRHRLRGGAIFMCLVWVTSVVASFLLGCMFMKHYMVTARRQESDLAWSMYPI